MGRFLVLFQPVEVLNISPKIRQSQSVLLMLVGCPVGVLERIGAENDLTAVFDNRFACDVDVECAFGRAVDSQLMAVELEFAVSAVVHKDSGFGDCGPNDTVLEVFQEENFCLLQQIQFQIVTVYNFECSSILALTRYLDLFIRSVLDTRNSGLFSIMDHSLSLCLNFLHPEVLGSPFELELLLGLSFFPQLKDNSVQFFEKFFVELSVVAGENVVDFEVVILHDYVMFCQTCDGEFPIFMAGNQSVHFQMWWRSYTDSRF